MSVPARASSCSATAKLQTSCEIKVSNADSEGCSLVLHRLFSMTTHLRDEVLAAAVLFEYVPGASKSQKQHSSGVVQEVPAALNFF